MNVNDMLTVLIPISSSLLSLIFAITSLILFIKEFKKSADSLHKITLKKYLYNKKIKVNKYNEDELAEIISNDIKLEKFQSENIDKQRDN